MNRIVNRTVVSLICIASLSACVSAPRGPHVAVMPSPGKSLDVFQQEDRQCRDYAQQSIGSDNRGDAAVGTAIFGTVLGAAIGAAMSTRRINNIGAGAATGLMIGSVAGAGNSAAEGQSAQRRYDIAYQQCMSTMQNSPASTASTASTQYRVSTPQQPNVVVIPPPQAPSAPVVSTPLPPPPPMGGYYPPPPGIQPPPPRQY